MTQDETREFVGLLEMFVKAIIDDVVTRPDDCGTYLEVQQMKADLIAFLQKAEK